MAERKFGASAPDADLSRLTPDELKTLERILEKALHGDAVEAEVITRRELPEPHEDEEES